MSGLLDLVLAGSRVAAVVGVVLVAVALAALVWLWLSARRARREVLAEVGSCAWVGVPQGYRRPEPVTELLPRCADDMDATVVIPRQRASVGGGRRG